MALLLAGSAAAAPATDTHPVTKRQPATAGKGKLAAPAASRQPVAPAPAVTPVLSEPASSPAAPQTVKLRGIVLAPDGRPCAGASVYPAGAPRQLVVTDAQGAFALAVPAGAPVALRIEYFGEGSSRVEVPVPSAELLHITLGK
ncbi:hypothetical protein GCM10023172_09080 [Hymenobacter ginsengisoli]|uniref:Carboxypeptidase regulatory-like domain-containing protein n=1 Tax=Hymenobacter ginsengisoli TaxID=1051626 RepID=A0ABP8Q2D2_9BACT|nr:MULTISPECIES: carboxypeptidase-like regulatory domain-containing protein [unclassified Hymenobacter]